MRWLRAFVSLWILTVRRLLWSTNTVMVLLPLTGGALFLLRRNYGSGADPENAFRSFSEFLLVIFASFLVPICAIAYGATSLGGDREDRTLVFLLVRPVPRPLLLLAKFAASWPLTIGLTVGSFWVYCRLAGAVGGTAFTAYWPAIFLMATAYVCLFHFFAVCFRHATILALLYSLFMELLIGNMPGIIKRVAINYYGRSLMYSAGRPHGLRAPDDRWFELLEPATAAWALVGIAIALMFAAMLIFQCREYRDLT
jgi:ABC-type transport system involved in multi-copper enzyme maturation permease subunit